MEEKINFRVTVKAMILNKNYDLLLLKRAAHLKVKPGIWEVPGGRLELGENPFLGLQREVKEETQLSVEIGKPVSVKHFTRSDGQVITMIIFKCLLEYQENLPLVKISPQEHDDFRWVSLDEAGSCITPFLKQEVVLLKEMQNNGKRL